MRVLLIAHNAYVEPVSGAALSVRAIMEWLHDGGHTCHAVASGRFDQSPGLTAAAVHDTLGVPVERTGGPRPVARFMLNGVSVAAVETDHALGNLFDRDGDAVFAAEIAAALRSRPDVVLAYGFHPAVHDGLATARRGGARTIYTVRGVGYDDPRWYQHADRVLMNTGFAARHFARTAGVFSATLPSPLVWREIEAPVETRGFVTFVNPSLRKGLALFARLADMLARRRPDIPMLIVGSGSDPAVLAAIPELNLASYPQILVSPPLPHPRDIWGLTRILVAPSVFDEPFGRVAAEAMINGIPVLVSDRGGLAETVAEGGIVLPLPTWMRPETRIVPSEAEVEPWFGAVVRLWDDSFAYDQAARTARAAAVRLYDEASLRRRYLAYFEDPGPFPLPLAGGVAVSG